MSRRKKDPLRALTKEEQEWLKRISRSRSEPVTHVARARQILSAPAQYIRDWVADGHNYTEAALLSGRKSGDAVSQLVSRFNREGLSAIEPGHGGGPQVKYGAGERECILKEVRRPPDPVADGTASWSLQTLQRRLRTMSDGLPDVSTYTIRTVLLEAGYSWQQSRSWCETGQVRRKRKSGVVTQSSRPSTFVTG